MFSALLPDANSGVPADTAAISTLAGSAGSPGSADGIGSATSFFYPQGVAVDVSGNVYVADTNNRTVRRITSDGVVTIFAGSAGNAGSTDGTGSAARFYYPCGVAVDASRNVYVADEGNYTIREVTLSAVVPTLAGLAGNHGRTDGLGSAARFYQPYGVAVDASGNGYVADTFKYTIREFLSCWLTRISTPPANETAIAGSSASIFGGSHRDAGSNLSVPDQHEWRE